MGYPGLIGGGEAGGPEGVHEDLEPAGDMVVVPHRRRPVGGGRRFGVVGVEGGQVLHVGLPGVVMGGPVADAGDGQRPHPVGVAEPGVQGGEAAHRQPHQMGPVDAQGVEHGHGDVKLSPCPGGQAAIQVWSPPGATPKVGTWPGRWKTEHCGGLR